MLSNNRIHCSALDLDVVLSAINYTHQRDSKLNLRKKKI